MEATEVVTTAHGNLLHADVDALVNTVNTVGIMGKGIALQFKRAYPEMFKDYVKAAKRGDVRLGHMHVWPTGSMTGPRFIINFPTKGHWRSSSTIEDIVAGLDALVDSVGTLGITSLAVPPLGCGNGGLDWAVVEPLIRERLSGISGLTVLLFAPEGAPAAAEMETAGPAPAMTHGRAVLIEMMARYTAAALAQPSLIETQKFMYLLQAAGERLDLEYAKHHYGPYSDRLRHVLTELEGHYTLGYGDGSTSVQQAEPLALMPGARGAARHALNGSPSLERIDEVMHLIEGFEPSYAMELLASAHWVMMNESMADDEALINAVRDWSLRKVQMFTPDHIVVAAERLRDRGWAPSLAGSTV